MNSDSYVLQRVDGLIANYQYSNKERVPEGVKMNSENANECVMRFGYLTAWMMT